MKIAKKIMAVTIASTMILSTATACSLLETKDKKKDKKSDDGDVLEEVVTEYMDYICATKYSKAAKLAVDGEDPFTDAIDDADFNDLQIGAFSVIVKNTEYEITDTNEKKETVTVTLTIPDVTSVEDAIDESSYLTELAKSSVDTIEEEVTIELEYDDDEETYLIANPESISDIYVDEAYKADIKSEVIVDEIVPVESSGSGDVIDNGYSIDLGGEIQVVPLSDFDYVEFYSDSSFTEQVESYKVGDEGVYIKFKTLDYYDADACFYVDVYIDGSCVVNHLEGTMRDPNGSDWGDISLAGPLQKGAFEIIITGFNEEPFAYIIFEVE